MSDRTSALLQQAYTLIENDEHDRAQEILAPLLEDDANNAHLWWVYSHAARDAAIGQAALERVLELDPKYPGARELKSDVLEAQSKDPDLIALGASESDASFTGAGFDVDEWEALQPVAETDSVGSSSRVPIVLLVVILIIVAGGAFVISGAVDLDELLAGLLPSPEPQVIVVSEATAAPAEYGAESIADQPEALSEANVTASVAPEATIVANAELDVTAAPSLLPEVTLQATVVAPESTADAMTELEEPQPATEPSPVATSMTYVDPPVVSSEEVAAFVSGIAEAISDFEVDTRRSGVQYLSLGNTLVIRLCAVPGPEFNDRLNLVMNAAVSLADDLPGGIQAFGAGLLHCDDPEAQMRIIGVARRAIIDYAKEEIKAKDFQRAWQPLS